MAKHRHVIFALLVVSAVACKKQEAAPPVKADAAVATATPTPTPVEKPVPVEKPFLWRIDGKNGPTYLFGTVHVGVNAETELPPSVWKAFESSKVFAMEADLNQVDYMKVMALSQMPEGDKLSSHLTKPQFDLLVKLSGAPADKLDTMRPWFALVMVLQRAVAGMKITAMDLVFQKKATETKKRLVYFEGANEQMEMLAQALDAPMLGRSLDEMVKQKQDTLDAMTAQLKQLIVAYKKGDASFDFASMGGYNDVELLEKLLYTRNKNWVPKVEELINEGNAFIAVGAMHLLGKKSVIDLLTAKGITPQRME